MLNILDTRMGPCPVCLEGSRKGEKRETLPSDQQQYEKYGRRCRSGNPEDLL